MSILESSMMQLGTIRVVKLEMYLSSLQAYLTFFHFPARNIAKNLEFNLSFTKMLIAKFLLILLLRTSSSLILMIFVIGVS